MVVDFVYLVGLINSRRISSFLFRLEQGVVQSGVLQYYKEWVKEAS